MTIKGNQDPQDIRIIVAGHPDIMATITTTIINIETIAIIVTAATIATTTITKETTTLI